MNKDIQVTIRLEADLAERAEVLVAKLGGVATRASILRAAMESGILALEAKYSDLPAPAVKTSKQRRK